MIPKSIDPNSFHYQDPPAADFQHFLKVVQGMMDRLATALGLPKDAIAICVPILIEIARRLDQRKDYFHYFHSVNDIAVMDQSKNLALLAYWIIRYKPFSLVGNYDEKCWSAKKCTINELAACYIVKAQVFTLVGAESAKSYFSADMDKDLIHAFAHGDVTKESMTLLFESLEKVLS